MVDIEKLLEEAINGTKTPEKFWKNKITDEAKPFWEACVERAKAGKPIKPYRIHKILEREYNVVVSDTAIRRYFDRLHING